MRSVMSEMNDERGYLFNSRVAALLNLLVLAGFILLSIAGTVMG